MNNKNLITALVSLFGAAFVFAVVFMFVGSLADKPDQGLVLRSYDVPPELAPEMSSILNGILEGEKGRVKLGPNGQLVVAAPESIQEGIAELIAEMNVDAPQPPPMITITYWAVVGQPASETATSANLQEIESALATIAEADGAASFGLLEKLRLRSLSGESGEAKGQQLRVRQRASTQAGRVIAELNLSGVGNFETTVNIEPDQLLVLGQTMMPGAKTADEARLYLVVRAQVGS